MEWDAAITGYKRPEFFFALWGTTTKLAYGLAFPLKEIMMICINIARVDVRLTLHFFKLIARIGIRHDSIDERKYEELMKK